MPNRFDVATGSSNSDDVPQPEAVELPTDRTVLVVVDMQNEFVSPEGRIYTGSMVHGTIPKIKNLLDLARRDGMNVIHTQSWYEKDDPRFSDHPKAKFEKGGCMAGSWGAEIIDDLKPLGREPVVRKSSYDCFFGTIMDHVLDELNFGEYAPGSVHRNRERNDANAIITGTVSNVCVEKAVIGFYLRGFDVVVPVDCISAKSAYAQQWALHQFSEFYGGRITRSDLLEFRKLEHPTVKSSP